MGLCMQEMNFIAVCDFPLVQSMFIEHIPLPSSVSQNIHGLYLMKILVHLHEDLSKI